LTAMQNIVPSHLADNAQFDFRGLTLDTAVEEGDIAFDQPEMPRSGGVPIALAPNFGMMRDETVFP
jgi:tRNA 2-thiocytidine biosynthesis protein TtcA